MHLGGTETGLRIASGGHDLESGVLGAQAQQFGAGIARGTDHGHPET